MLVLLVYRNVQWQHALKCFDELKFCCHLRDLIEKIRLFRGLIEDFLQQK